MAGRGQRFKDARVLTPKWAISPILGPTLLSLSISAILSGERPRSVHIIANVMDLEQADPIVCCPALRSFQTTIHTLNRVLPGPLATLWAIAQHADWSDDVIVQVCDTAIEEFEPLELAATVGASVGCFASRAPNLCHVDVDRHGMVLLMREKVGEPSGTASSGLFVLRDLPAFAKAAETCLQSPCARESGEYYLSDAVNNMIASGALVSPIFLKGVKVLGTPEELAARSNKR